MELTNDCVVLNDRLVDASVWVGCPFCRAEGVDSMNVTRVEYLRSEVRRGLKETVRCCDVRCNRCRSVGMASRSGLRVLWQRSL